SSAGPEPAEGSCHQQAVDQAVDHFLEYDLPWLAVPDPLAHAAKAVGKKTCRAGHAEDLEVRRSDSARSAREIAHKERDHERVEEVENEEFAEGKLAGIAKQQECARPALHLRALLGRQLVPIDAR